MIDARPILIDESRSIFSTEEIARHADQAQFPKDAGWKRRVREMLPAASGRARGPESLAHYSSMLPDEPSVLVIGCGLTHERYATLFPSARLYLTDVTLQGDASIICDGGCLPFRNESLDCIVIDQVLEHAIDPVGIVAEVYRCLKSGGIIFSGVPFHYPIHGFPYDFQRFSPVGHRMLFRGFDTLELKITQGSVSALSLTLIAFCSGIWRNAWWKRLSSLGVRLALGPFLSAESLQARLDELSIPAASAFIGKKRMDEISPREILRSGLSIRS